MTSFVKTPTVWVPVSTPFRDDLEIDAEAYVRHCRRLLDDGADGLAVFGTTSEANSLGLGERMALLDRLIDAGVDPGRLMPGTGCCATADTVELTRHAVEHGCAGVLMLPPFYYKGVSDDGLFDAFARVIDAVGDDRLRVFLYHIPPMAAVPISVGLLDRLASAYPNIVAGVKDSSGDWDNTKAMIAVSPELAIFSGSEKFLLDNIKAGGAGCISATANVNVPAMRALIDGWQTTDADQMQRDLNAGRLAFEAYPMVAAVKAFLAAQYDDPGWMRTRPPLQDLPSDARESLLRDLGALGAASPLAGRSPAPQTVANDAHPL